MRSVYIAGTGLVRFGKLHEPLIELLVQVARRALCECESPAVDALYVGLMNPEGFVGDGNFAAWLTDRLGLSGTPAVHVEATSSTGAAALHEAVNAVASGRARRALVVAGDAMTHLPTRKVTQLLAQVIAPRDRRSGATMPALAALVTQRWIHDAPLSPEDCQRALMAVALKNHEAGQHNPHAQFQQAITPERYLSSRGVSSPLRLYDCAPISDGAAALVLTAEPTDVRVWGIGQGTDTLSLCSRPQLTAFRATRLAARRAYEMAGCPPQQITFAEIHDAFTPFEVLSLEDTGLFPPGQAPQAELAGETRIRGKLPVNASGGLKARGHPVSASGLAQVIEAVRQMRHQVAEAVQVPRPRLALCQSTGGLFNQSFVTVLGPPRRRRVPLPQEVIEQLDAPAPAPRAAGAVPRQGARAVLESFTYLSTPAEGFPAPLLLALVRSENGARVLARGDPDRPVEIGQTVYLKRSEASGQHGPYYFTDDPERLKRGEVSVRMLTRKGPLAQVKDMLAGAHLRPRYFAVKDRS